MAISRKKKILFGAAAAVGVAGMGVGAFAYWTSTGSGSGTASTTAGTSNLSYTQAPLNPMYPGDSAQTLTVTVKNEDPVSGGQAQYVPTVKAYITTSNPACTGADFLLKGSPAPSVIANAVPLTWTATNLAPQGTALTGPDTIQFNNLPNTNQDACKGVTVTITYVTD